MARFWEREPEKAMTTDEFAVTPEKKVDLDYLNEKFERHWMSERMRRWAAENALINADAKRILNNAADSLDWGPAEADRGKPPYGF